MPDLMHLRVYTKELKRRLPKEYFEPVPTRALWIIPHVAIVVLGITTIALWAPSIWVKLACTLLIGHSFASLGFLAHEILHGAVVKNARLRDFLGGICFLQFNLGAKLWRKWHNVEHHGHTQHDHDDPDAMGTLESLRERPALRSFYRIAPWLRSLFTFISFTFWFSLHNFIMWRRFLPEFKKSERPAVIAQFVLPVLLWTSLLVILGPVNWIFAYLIPVLMANFIVMSYIATNHLLNPLTQVNDPLANSLTVRVPKLVDMLHFNFSLHTEHHIFPNMNPKYMPKVREMILQLWPDRYNEMPHWKALRALWKTPRLYRDHQESPLVDPVRNYTFATVGRGMDPDRMKPEIGKLPPEIIEPERAPSVRRPSEELAGSD